MTHVHTYYNHFLSTLLERLVSPHIDEETWQERLHIHQEVIEVKERIWLREAQTFVHHATPYLEQIESLLDLTFPPLKQLMSYRGEDERRDYTRMTDYRGALLDERDRIASLLEQLGAITPAKVAAVNDDIEVVHHAHP